MNTLYYTIWADSESYYLLPEIYFQHPYASLDEAADIASSLAHAHDNGPHRAIFHVEAHYPNENSETIETYENIIHP